MARTKEVWAAKYVPGSARAEGKDVVSFNITLKHDPDRVVRVTESVRTLENMLRDLRREKERSAARDIFSLGE